MPFPMQELWPKFIALGVIPVDTPVPMSMLRHLWKVTDNTVAEKLAKFFTSVGVMKMATLSDNTIWALVQPGHLKALHVSLPAWLCHLALKFTLTQLQFLAELNP